MFTTASIRRPIAAVTGLVLAGLAVPALATPAPAPAALVQDAGAPEPTAATSAPARKICFGRTASGATEITGSMLSRKVCKTKAEWEADGVQFATK